MLAEDRLQGFVDESGFTRAAYACYNDEFAKWKLYVDVFQVVTLGATNPYTLAVTFPAYF